MKEKQFKEIAKWQRETFPDDNVESKLLHLIEEVCEVSESLNSSKRKYITSLEIADCLILLAGIADSIGHDYKQICVAIDHKMKINKTRSWQKSKCGRYYKHIEGISNAE